MDFAAIWILIGATWFSSAFTQSTSDLEFYLSQNNHHPINDQLSDALKKIALNKQLTNEQLIRNVNPNRFSSTLLNHPISSFNHKFNERDDSSNQRISQIPQNEQVKEHKSTEINNLLSYINYLQKINTNSGASTSEPHLSVTPLINSLMDETNIRTKTKTTTNPIDNLYNISEKVVNQFNSDLNDLSLKKKLSEILHSAKIDIPDISSNIPNLSVQNNRRYSNFLSNIAPDSEIVDNNAKISDPISQNSGINDMQSLTILLQKIDRQQQDILKQQIENNRETNVYTPHTRDIQNQAINEKINYSDLLKKLLKPQAVTPSTITVNQEENLDTTRNHFINVVNKLTAQIEETPNSPISHRNQQSAISLNNITTNAFSSQNNPNFLEHLSSSNPDTSSNPNNNPYITLLKHLRASNGTNRITDTNFDIDDIDNLGTREVTPTSIAECLTITLCSFAIAVIVAVSTTGAFAVPILAPVFGFIGKRKRRNLEYIVYTKDNSSNFIDNYMRFLDNNTLPNGNSPDSLLFHQYGDLDREFNIKNRYIEVIRFLADHKNEFIDFANFKSKKDGIENINESLVNETANMKFGDAVILPAGQNYDRGQHTNYSKYRINSKDISGRSDHRTGTPITARTQLYVLNKKEDNSHIQGISKDARIQTNLNDGIFQQNLYSEENSRTEINNTKHSTLNVERIPENTNKRIFSPLNSQLLSNYLKQNSPDFSPFQHLPTNPSSVLRDTISNHDEAIKALPQIGNIDLTLNQNSYSDSVKTSSQSIHNLQKQQTTQDSISNNFGSSISQFPNILNKNSEISSNSELNQNTDNLNAIEQYLASLTNNRDSLNTNIFQTNSEINQQNHLSNFVKYYQQIQLIENLRKQYIEKILTDYLSYQINTKLPIQKPISTPEIKLSTQFMDRFPSPLSTSSFFSDNKETTANVGHSSLMKQLIDSSSKFEQSFSTKQNQELTKAHYIRDNIHNLNMRPSIVRQDPISQRNNKIPISNNVLNSGDDKKINPEVKYFYQVLCTAIVGPDIPLNKVTSYIAEKCIVMKYIGLI